MNLKFYLFISILVASFSVSAQAFSCDSGSNDGFQTLFSCEVVDLRTNDSSFSSGTPPSGLCVLQNQKGELAVALFSERFFGVTASFKKDEYELGSGGGWAYHNEPGLFNSSEFSLQIDSAGVGRYQEDLRSTDLPDISVRTFLSADLVCKAI